MAKPILLIKANESVIPPERITEVSQSVELNLKYEYHVLIYVDNNNKETAFQTFNVDKEPEINIEELKKELNESK